MKYLIIFLVSVNLVWACDYLDMVPENDIETVETVFETRTNADSWIEGLYSSAKELSTDLSVNVAYLGADEFTACDFMLNYGTETGGSTYLYPGFRIAQGFEMSQDPYDNFWTPAYTLIRDCNTFLENIDDVYNMEEIEKKQWKSEVQGLKAYMYFELVRRYGPICLVPNNLPADADISVLQLPRMHVDTCFKEIVNLCDSALRYASTSAMAGQTRKPYFHQEAIQVLKAKALLYAASPLFNGNPVYSTFTGKNGEPLFSAQNDPEKWRLAAEEAKKAVELCEKGDAFTLCEGTQGDGILRTMNGLEQVAYSQFNNPEYILEWKRGSHGGAIAMYLLPLLHAGDEDYASTIYGGLAPSMKMVEMYYTEHGLPIESDVTWNYANRYRLGKELRPIYKDIVPLADDDKLADNEKEVLQLHLAREPRFYANIAADRTYWQRGVDSYVKDYTFLVEAWKDERFGTTSDFVVTNTWQNPNGYWVKKHLRSSITNTAYYSSLSNDDTHPVFRLAEVYLMLAEAWNEYYGPCEEVYNAIDKVRERAGIPGVVEAWTSYSNEPGKVTTKEGMRDIIRQEINIELAFEGHRYWNLRRWLTAELELNEVHYGWNILGDRAQTFYNNFNGPIVVWNKAKFTAPRDYLTPLKAEEILMSGMVQNPGW